MREIKFRAWDGKRMCKTFGFGKGYAVGGEGIALNDLIKAEQAHGMAIMQFTGLKDKNGKEIYESDIVSAGVNKEKCLVVFEDGMFCLKRILVNGEFAFMVEENCEIIGNIYENGDLLK